MAGLGTGAAPFRAFIQERAWQKAQGKEVGPLVYYFGSRHRGQEYLYGEELEAYFKEGVVTHLGLAFSRDTDKKVYIQHKIQEDGQLLAKLLGPDNGAFFLCGPSTSRPLLPNCVMSKTNLYIALQLGPFPMSTRLWSRLSLEMERRSRRLKTRSKS